MRAFIAIDLPQDVKDYLSKIQEHLKNSAADIKWVAPKNIHLTLKFLGEIDARKTDKICRILDDISKDRKIFTISLSSLGVFPDMRHPRVIWVGLEKGEKEIQELVTGIEDELSKIHIRKEKRPFSSHITIARVKSGRIDNLPDKLGPSLIGIGRTIPVGLKSIIPEFTPTPKKAPRPVLQNGVWKFTAHKITFFKSTLTSTGPIYEVIKEASLTPA